MAFWLGIMCENTSDESEPNPDPPPQKVEDWGSVTRRGLTGDPPISGRISAKEDDDDDDWSVMQPASEPQTEPHD